MKKAMHQGLAMMCEKELFEEWAFQHVGQFTRAGFHGTNGKWIYSNHNIQNLLWECWQARANVGEIK